MMTNLRGDDGAVPVGSCAAWVTSFVQHMSVQHIAY